ncbi:MAG TPA: hypothetical protein VFC07_07430 [Verrucomicrobiae bacterium]|nr:hypothetical protein [Verrucomicrobiae bacterium]
MLVWKIQSTELFGTFNKQIRRPTDFTRLFAAGATLHATIDFISKSTPLIGAGVITTNTDKTIRSNPTQLEQDIAKAKALGEAYDVLEAKLKNLREATAAGQENNAPLNDAEKMGSDATNKLHSGPAEVDQEWKPSLPGHGAPEAGENGASQKEPQVETSRLEPLGWFKAGIEGLRLVVEALPKFFGTAGNPAAASLENPEKIPVAEPAPSRPGRAEAQAKDVAKMDFAASAAPTTAINLPPSPGNGLEENVMRESPQPARQQEQPGAAGLEQNEAASQVAESHAQAIQFSGEKMRSGLEQNNQITISLFNRTLDLIDQQNRKLGEVDRKIAELGGQIKSLKNL